MYTLDRAATGPFHSTDSITDRPLVTVLRAGIDPVDLASAAELSRRHGDRWLVIDGTAPNTVVRATGAPAILWLGRRGRVAITLNEGTFALDAGQYAVTEAGDRLEVASGTGRDSGFVALVPPARLAARLQQRITGAEAVEPVLLMQQGTAAALIDAFEQDRLERALVVASAEWMLSDLGEMMLMRLLDRQRAFEPAIDRTSGRTVRHKRHLYARLNRVQHLVAKGPVRDYSMRELADVAALSVWHFVRMYGQVYGETPHRFLTRVRLERAAALLASSDASIATVAERLGFENRCAFARLFRSHFGVPASVHRREARLAAAKRDAYASTDVALPANRPQPRADDEISVSMRR